ncbi:MAG: helix-turn-helix domain-containing protein [Acidimicrobiales bacterium]
MPGQRLHTASLAATTLRRARELRGLSLRRAASLVDVSPQAWKRYEEGARRLPVGFAALVSERLAPLPEARERIRATVGTRPRRSAASMRRHLPSTLHPVLDEMLGRGELAEHLEAVTTSDGRRYERPIVALVSSQRAKGLERSVPITIGGDVLRAARLGAGLGAAEMAGRAGVSPATWRVWEARSVPRARTADVAGTLPAPEGAEIKRLREAAGWSLYDLGRRVGVTLGVVHAWESGKRRVPGGRLIALLGALHEAETAAVSRHEALVDRIVEQVRSEPGVSEGRLVHESRIKVEGVAVESPAFRSAFDDAKRRRLIVTATVTRPDYASSRSGLFARGAAPKKAPVMTGSKLAARRLRLDMSQRELAERCQVSTPTVIAWEKKGNERIPEHGAARAAAAFEQVAGEDRPASVARSAILKAMRGEPGISTSRLREEVGHGKVATREIKELERAKKLRKAVAYDSCGRRYEGWYLAGEAPVLEPLSGAELKRLREAAGWRQAALAEELGVSSNAVWRWESGKRTCPPVRTAEIRSILARPAPVGREERILSEVVAAAKEKGGASRTELGWPQRRRFIERALELGHLRSERVDVEHRDGRVYRQERLFAASEPSPQRAERPTITPAALRALRRGAGLSQHGFGRLIGVEHVTVSGWETGRNPVPPRRATQLAALIAGGESDRQTDRQTG